MMTTPLFLTLRVPPAVQLTSGGADVSSRSSSERDKLNDGTRCADLPVDDEAIALDAGGEDSHIVN